MKAAPVFEAGNHRWWILYDQEERRVIDSNVYIVESNGQSVLLDPGGFEIFPQVLAALAEVIQPSSVRGAFVSHQDPDIASSLPLWNTCYRHMEWHIPALWESFIRHYGGIHTRSLSARLGQLPRLRCGGEGVFLGRRGSGPAAARTQRVGRW
jgi:flavorubredoxin